MLASLTSKARANLAVQKETLTTALELAGIDTQELLAWSPASRTPSSFLEGIPQAAVREDATLISDFSSIPGFEAIRQYPFTARTFETAASVYPHTVLKVIMANRLPLEQQTGADFIYFNGTFGVVMLVDSGVTDTVGVVVAEVTVKPFSTGRPRWMKRNST